MSRVVVDREQMDRLINASVDALDLMDDVHAYDTQQYYALKNILNELELEDLDE